MTSLVRTARRRLQREHPDVIEAIDRRADAVAESWDGDRVTDRRAVVAPLRAELDRTGVLSRLPGALSDVVSAAGYDAPAVPVAGPPYVVVTSRGPMCRATLDPGRLVIRFDAFSVQRGHDDGPRYRRLDGVELVVSLE